MAIFIMTVWYPFNKALEVGNLVTKYSTLPDSITKWRMLSVADGKEGLKSYNILYVKDDKIVDAELYLARLQQEFANQIDGYTYKVEVAFSPSDMQKAVAITL